METTSRARTLDIVEHDDRVVVTLCRPTALRPFRGLAALPAGARAPAHGQRTKLVVDHPGAHPVADDLAQAVLFEGADKRDRMTRFLDRSTGGGRA